MTIPVVLSIIFGVVATVYLLLGIYAAYLNPSDKTNILFFSMSVTLTIWTFAFSMAINAETLALAIFWRRFAAVGFSLFFAIMLQFAFVLTGHQEYIKRKFVLVLLYLPAIASLLGFTYIPVFSTEQYHIIWTQFGWINESFTNSWKIFFSLYVLSYSSAALVLIWWWGSKTENRNIHRQSRLILISFASSLILSMMTDDFLRILFVNKNTPQMAPVFIIVPAIMVYYMIRRYGFLNPKQADNDVEIFLGQIQEKSINYLANALLLTALINLISTGFLKPEDSMFYSLSFSVFLVLIGLLFQAIQRSGKSVKTKTILNAVLMFVIVPVLTFRYIDTAGVKIWPFVSILIILSLVFDSSLVQITLGISIVLTQIAIWIIKPEVSLVIDGTYHFVRFGLYLIAIWFAWFFRKILQNKLRENTDHISLQRIVTSISSDFIKVTDFDLEQKTEAALSQIGVFLGLSRAYIYINNPAKACDTMIKHSFWYDHNLFIDDAEPDLQISQNAYPELIKHILGGQTISISNLNTSDLPVTQELARLTGSFESACVVIPINIKDDIYGFVCFDTDRRTSVWPESQLAAFTIFANVFSNAYERIMHEREVTKLAYFDHLTNLPNRNLFRDKIDQTIQRIGQKERIFAVVFLDMDAFKSVNDSIGHDGGDALLTKVTAQLRGLIRPGDTLSRFGGDEFLLLLDNLLSVGDIRVFLDRIFTAFARSYRVCERDFVITASAGIAVFPYDGRDAESLIKHADIAMYQAKNQGKNQYTFCTADMKDDIIWKMNLTNSLFNALAQDEFKVFYQPKIDAKSQQVTGAEALLRWFHPVYGAVSPGVFVPLAEQNGLIEEIGKWVLQTACKQCYEWQISGMSEFKIAVNVSILQLRNPSFVDIVSEIIRDTKIDAANLELEITESATVEEPVYIVRVLENLKALGLSISIDDFGTQYSSLSRLAEMPIDTLKIDMHFVHRIGHTPKDNAIVRAIIRMAHSLDLRVISEGVETAEQLDYLTLNHSDELQGFLYSKPLPADEFESKFKEINHLIYSHIDKY